MKAQSRLRYKFAGALLLLLLSSFLVYIVTRLDVVTMADSLSIALSLGFGVALTAIISWHLERDVAGPLARIGAAVTKMSDGHLGVPLPQLLRGDEIGQLAQSVELWRQSAQHCKSAYDHLRLVNVRHQDRLFLVETLMIEMENLVNEAILALSEASRTMDKGILSISSLADLSQGRAQALAATSSLLSKHALGAMMSSEEMAASAEGGVLQAEAVREGAAKALKKVKGSADDLRQGFQNPNVTEGGEPQEAIRQLARLETLTANLSHGLICNRQTAKDVQKNVRQLAEKVEEVFQTASEAMSLSNLAANLAENLSVSALQLSAKAEWGRSEMNGLLRKAGNASTEEDGTFFKWDDDMASGHILIDKEHMILAAYLNDLHLAMHRGLGEETAERIAAGLADFVKAHLGREERLLADLPPDRKEAFIMSQQSFLARVEGLRQSLQKKNGMVSAQLLASLKAELHQHVHQTSHFLAEELSMVGLSLQSPPLSQASLPPLYVVSQPGLSDSRQASVL